MKKALIVILVILIVGGGGFLGYGYNNARVAKAYATDAKKLVNDFEDKYSDENIDKGINVNNLEADTFDEAKKAIRDAKKDAESALESLGSKKSNKFTSNIKSDSEEYFTITVDTVDNLLVYFDYFTALVTAGEGMTGISSLGGSADDLDAVADQFDSMKKSIDESIKSLESATVPDPLKDMDSDLKKALKDLSDVLGDMSTALRAGDLTLYLSHAESFGDILVDLTGLDYPETDEITNDIVSKDNQDKLEDLPGEITTEADSIIGKTFLFW